MSCEAKQSVSKSVTGFELALSEIIYLYAHRAGIDFNIMDASKYYFNKHYI